MSEYVRGTKMVTEEKKAVKLFIWMFYTIFFLYDFLYFYILPLSFQKEVGHSQFGMGLWLYPFLLALLPIGIYLIKIGKLHLVKYEFFIGYFILDIVNNLMIYIPQDIPFQDGNVLDIFIVLFATIFVNKRYFWLISLGTISKYSLIGLILQDMNAIFPVGILIFITLVSLIILTRFLSYIGSLTSAHEDLRQQEKLAFLGQMSTSIGHEIRNPLSSLRGFTQLQQERDSSETSFYPIMIQEIDRISTIVDDLMILGRPKSPNIRPHDFNDVINYVTTVTNQLAEIYGIKVEVKHCEDVPLIDCDDKQMKQVLINLVKNAIESIQNGGFVEIGCYCVDADRIKVIVQDQGSGIDQETINRLGEPFYTTKPEGTGLGLMVSKKIVEDHFGEIQFESEKDKGTKVTVIIPIKHIQA